MANAPLPSQANAPQGGPTATCEVTGQTLPIADTTVLFGQRVGAEGKQRLLEQWQWNRDQAMDASVNEQPCRPWDRIGAAVVDGVLMLMLVGTLTLLLILAAALIGGLNVGTVWQQTSTGQHFGVTALVFLFACTILPAMYMAFFHAQQAQGTLGKDSVDAKLTTLSGQRVGSLRAMWRVLLSHAFWCPALLMQLFWLHQIDTSGWLFQWSKHLGWMHGVLTAWPWLVFWSCLLIPAFNLACLFVSPNRRMLHDVLAGTKVVQAKQGV